ncbi:MAG: DUF4230 domain-containing protein [Duncaniella sp.]|jgi:hypothetical protein|uniref:DUF4230 domain-containing protein n=1 Tax=Duncaniella muricolitica TaxID=2880704 RepID=UPI00244DC74F|nr:DUF4230 domain-containing protein [Duncaniella muricolitica]
MNIIHHLIPALLLSLPAAGLWSCAEEEQRDNVLFSEVKSVDKLILARMTVSKMATIDDIPLSEAEGLKQTSAALLDALKLGKRKAAYSYDTYLRAYIDLSNLTPDDVKVDESTKTITLSLPPVTTEYLGRNMEIREDHYRVTGLRSEIDVDERAALKEQMNTVLKNEVKNKPMFRNKLVTEAKAKAEAYFSSMLGKDGYKVIINFKEDR